MKSLKFLAWIPSVRKALDELKKSKLPVATLMLPNKEILLVQSDDLGNMVRLPEWGIGEIWYQDKPWGHLKAGWVIHLGIETKLVRNGELYAIGWNGVEESMGPNINLLPGDILQFDKCEHWTGKGSPSYTEITMLQSCRAA